MIYTNIEHNKISLSRELSPERRQFFSVAVVILSSRSLKFFPFNILASLLENLDGFLGDIE